MSEPDDAQAASAIFEISTTVNAACPTLWQQAREACAKALDQGHAFAVVLREADALADEGLLADEDCQRAARYRRSRDRHNFILGRTLVHHLVRPPNASAPCVFSFGRNGKPFLPGCAAFNLSHSDDWIACVVSHRILVGIDVETFQHLRNYLDLLAMTTHPAERCIIDQATAARRLALFKRCWTRKEAVLKATGMGLSDDLCSIDVQLDESEPVLGSPAYLRILDLPVDDDRISISLALDARVLGIAVMFVY
jgi:phosphopantetheinyl transferase